MIRAYQHIKSGEKRATIAVYVPESIKDRLNKIADHKNVSVSNLIRGILEKSLEKELTEN